MTLSEAYYRKKKEAEQWKTLRLDAIDRGEFEASIAYGFVAIRLMNDAIAIADADLAHLR